MSALIFLLTTLTTFILLVLAIVGVIRGKPIYNIVRLCIGIVLTYGLVWTCFWFFRDRPVKPYGYDICFDDWCATVSKAEPIPSNSRDSARFMLEIIVSNHARGIAQRPSEPRIHLVDGQGRFWSPIFTGLNPLDTRLELGESKTINLNFVLAANATKIMAIIEEGPWITNLLFPEDQPVFKIR